MHSEQYEPESLDATTTTNGDRTLSKLKGAPGIYRRGGRYVVRFRDQNGKQHKRSAKTLAEARRLKSELTADVSRGEYRERSRLTFAEYAPLWVSGYAGRTSGGLRDNTRRAYAIEVGVDPDTGELLDPPRGAVEFWGGCGSRRLGRAT